MLCETLWPSNGQTPCGRHATHVATALDSTRAVFAVCPTCVSIARKLPDNWVTSPLPTSAQFTDRWAGHLLSKIITFPKRTN